MEEWELEFEKKPEPKLRVQQLRGKSRAHTRPQSEGCVPPQRCHAASLVHRCGVAPCAIRFAVSITRINNGIGYSKTDTPGRAV